MLGYEKIPEEETPLFGYDTFLQAFHREDETEFHEYIGSLLDKRDFLTISSYSQKLLAEFGIQEAVDLDYTNPVIAIALAEAVNLAAKEIDYRFYELKPAMVIAAWKIGASFGYNTDDSTYSLFDPHLGTASFHDPNGEIEHIIKDVLEEKEPEWKYEWSQVTRQELAFDVFADLKNTGELVAELIRTTTPKQLQGTGIEFRTPKKDDLLDTYGKASIQVKLRDALLATERLQLEILLTIKK